MGGDEDGCEYSEGVPWQSNLLVYKMDISGCITAGKSGTGCCGAPDYSLCDDGVDDGLDYCLGGECK